MTISSATARVTFNCDGSTQDFPVSIQAYNATDFLVLHTSAGIETTLVLNSDYSLTAAGTLSPQAWSMSTTIVYPPGDTLQVVLNPVQTHLSQYVQGQAFPSLVVQTDFDRLTQMVQRLQDQVNRSIRAPDGDVNPIMLLPAAVAREFMNLTTDGSGNIVLSQTLNAGVLSRASIGNFLYPILAGEIGVTDTSYPYGYFRRFGAQGKGWLHDDTAAVQNCLNCSVNVYGYPGDVYGVQQVTFPDNGIFTLYDGQGAGFQGIATSPTNGCVVRWMMSSATIIRNYYVACVGNGSTVPSPNPNYIGCTQWYNGVAGSQFISVGRVLHLCQTRGFVYGALPGQTPTGGTQSENTIAELQNIGIANPFYANTVGGFIEMQMPMLVVSNITWTSAFPTTTPRALENPLGNTAITIIGGELEYAFQATGFAADLASCVFIGTNFETAAPIQIVGDSVTITGGQLLNTQSNQPAFKVAAGVTGSLVLNGPFVCERDAGIGATGMVPMVDSTAAPNFKVVLSGTSSKEWPWNMQGQDIRLVAGGKPVYHNHRMNITASDPNTYTINNEPFDSLLPPSFDDLGYTTNGWNLTTDFGAGTTMLATSNAGPTGYLNAQITLHATGQAVATNANANSLSLLQGSALRVKPGELFFAEGQFNTTSGSGGSFVARCYNLSGALVSDLTIADPVALGTGAWKYILAPLVIPAGVAYIGIGPKGVASDVGVTKVRIRRA